MEKILRLNQIKDESIYETIRSNLFYKYNIVIKEDNFTCMEDLRDNLNIYCVIPHNEISITFSNENKFAKKETDEDYQIAISFSTPNFHFYNSEQFLDVITFDTFNRILNTMSIRTNNKRFVNISITENQELKIQHFDDIKTMDKETIISQGDFISMLNWYYYQKENGNKDLMF